MKKTLILITTIILALSMVSCNIQEFVSGWGTTSTTSGETTTSGTTEDKIINKVELQELFPLENVSNVLLWLGTTDNYFGRTIKNLEFYYEKILNGVLLTDDDSEIQRFNDELNSFFEEEKKVNPHLDKWPYQLTFYDLDGVIIGQVFVYLNNSVRVHLEGDENIEYVNVSGYTISQSLVYDLWSHE